MKPIIWLHCFMPPNWSWVMIEIQQGSQKVKGQWYIPILGIKGRWTMPMIMSLSQSWWVLFNLIYSYIYIILRLINVSFIETK